MNDLTFKGERLPLIEIDGTHYVTASVVAEILYGKGGTQTATPFESRIRDLYRRHSDEFTPTMTRTVKLPTAGGEQSVRVFSLRGCHLLGMFARTPVAKEFRVWVLDVLDGAEARNRELWPRLQVAIADLIAEQKAASVYGRGLRRWRLVKPGKEGEVERLTAELQLHLDID